MTKLLVVAAFAALLIVPAASAGRVKASAAGASCTVSTTNVANDTVSGSGIPQEKPIYLYVLNADGSLHDTLYAGFFFGVQPESTFSAAAGTAGDIGAFIYQYGGPAHNGNWHIYAECAPSS